MANDSKPKRRGARVAPAPSAKAPATAPRTGLLLGSSALIVLVVVAAILLGRGSPATGLDLTGIPQEGNTLGSPGAPLTIREFTDYSCPTCKSAAEKLLPRIIEEYVRSGQVRIEFIPVGLIQPPGSSYAAMAALCAAEQDRIWPYQERLYAIQGQRPFDPTTLAGLTEGVGLADVAAFQNCVASGKYQRQVEANNEAFRTSTQGRTPTFLVGNQLFEGVPPWDQVKGLIDAQLAALP